jgi:hypothetical protein
MKIVLAMFVALCVAGCEWNVREEPAPRPYEPPTYDYDPSPTPVPLPPSSGTTPSSDPQLPPSSSSDGGVAADAAAEPNIACDGLEKCRAIQTVTECEAEVGCWVVPR